MDKELRDRAEAILQGITQLRDSLDYDAKNEEIAQLERAMAQEGFWDNPESSQSVVAQLKAVRAIVKPMVEVSEKYADIQAAMELAEEDESFADELPAELEQVEAVLEDLRFKALLSGPHDSSNALLTIHARDGGTDANDWADMMLRMYSRWAEEQGFSVSLVDRQENEVAGINSAVISVRGPFVYGYLKGETGPHRLVRISPFNADGKRQTSFAAVDVSPEIPDDSAEIVLAKSDYREDVYKASGAGGQHVNKTSSAIRLTHHESGIVVTCQNERSQHKNRATALKMLRAQLARQKEEKRELEQAAKYNNQPKTGFGSQIRNYFQHPDQRVKDTRTGHLIGNFQSVIDGGIQPFLEAHLRWRVEQS
ncbi:MAG: peptide chain release factor 2 [Planctomycetales bacterium]